MLKYNNIIIFLLPARIELASPTYKDGILTDYTIGALFFFIILK